MARGRGGGLGCGLGRLLRRLTMTVSTSGRISLGLSVHKFRGHFDRQCVYVCRRSVGSPLALVVWLSPRVRALPWLLDFGVRSLPRATASCGLLC